jgi:hypothetical protein
MRIWDSEAIPNVPNRLLTSYDRGVFGTMPGVPTLLSAGFAGVDASDKVTDIAGEGRATHVPSVANITV